MASFLGMEGKWRKKGSLKKKKNYKKLRIAKTASWS